MKVIDLLNKIANGEVNENTLVEFDNGYKDYCTVRIFFDRYIMDRENLNCEVEIIEEDKKIEHLKYNHLTEEDVFGTLPIPNMVVDKINEIIDKLNEVEK